MENEIITDWLDKYGNSEIYKKVEDYIEKTNMEDEYIIISKTAIQRFSACSSGKFRKRKFSVTTEFLAKDKRD